MITNRLILSNMLGHPKHECNEYNGIPSIDTRENFSCCPISCHTPTYNFCGAWNCHLAPGGKDACCPRTFTAKCGQQPYGEWRLSAPCHLGIIWIYFEKYIVCIDCSMFLPSLENSFNANFFIFVYQTIHRKTTVMLINTQSQRNGVSKNDI